MTDERDRSSAPPRALRLLVEELRACEPPRIDWDPMEARLLEQLEAGSGGVGAAGAAATLSPSTVDTSGVVDLLAGAGGGARREGGVDAEILVPWDDDPADAEAWKDIRRPVSDEAGSPRTDVPSGLHPGARSTTAGDRTAAGRTAADRTAAGRTAAGRTAAGRTAGAGRWMAAAAAVLAVAAGWALAPGGPPDAGPADPVDLASVAREPRLGGALDLASLRAGDVVEATEGPVRFGREGVLAWTLSAGGRLRVVSGVGHEEPRHVVALETGALDVEVVPATAPSPPERFVVEVGDARVAVHGTAFRVVRSTQGLVVDVSRGVVAVGPRGGPRGEGHRLEAPQRAAFALDGGGYRPLPERAAAASSGDERYAGLTFAVDPAAPPSGVPAVQPGSAPGASSPPASSSVPRPVGSGVEPGRDAAVQPAIASPGGGGAAPAAHGWSVGRLHHEVSSCIARTGAGSSEARVTLSTSLVVDVDDAGEARSVRFDPPIRPDLQACAQAVFRGRFEPGRVVVPLEVVLEPREPSRPGAR